MNERRKEGTEGRQKGGRKGKERRMQVREGGMEGERREGGQGSIDSRFNKWTDGWTDG